MLFESRGFPSSGLELGLKDFYYRTTACLWDRNILASTRQRIQHLCAFLCNHFADLLFYVSFFVGFFLCTQDMPTEREI